MYLTI